MADLRRSGTEAKRDHDHKAKWAYGARNRQNLEYSEGLDVEAARPGLPIPHSKSEQMHFRRLQGNTLKRTQNATRIGFQFDVKEALTSDSSFEEPLHESVAPKVVAEDDAVSSFDASGQTVLSAAVLKAVNKYENKVTEKLAMEYEFVAKDDEHSTGYLGDEDDFEVIGHVEI